MSKRSRSPERSTRYDEERRRSRHSKFGSRDEERSHRRRDRDRNSRSKSPRQRKPYEWGSKPPLTGANADEPQPEPEEIEKDKPNFGLSGLLATETNTYNGVVLKYNEPPEARKPSKQWRLYVFKGKEEVDLFYVHRQSVYLFGRDRAVVDIPIDHPSCSKQHAVLQYRQVTSRNAMGEISKRVEPFVIDLESVNGTMVNGKRIPTSRYYELRQSDIIKFGHSSREYVLLHDQV